MRDVGVPELYNAVSSGVCRISAQIGQYIASGSGFIVANKLVTCGHVYYDLPSDSAVSVSFADGTCHSFPKYVIDGAVKALSDGRGFDYCVLDLPIDLAGRHQFKFRGIEGSVGETVLGLGYPFGQTQLSIHKGIISASYRSGVADMLQLDMSVNPANSGGPLIDSEGNVVAVICRKATGLTTMFDRLRTSFVQNQNVLRAAMEGGFISISGVNPLELGITIQVQMQQIATEIARSANVGIGYAISVSQLAQEQCFE